MRQERSFSDELARLAVSAGALPGDAALCAYARHLNRLFGEPEPLFTERCRPIVEEELSRPGPRPFLSVVTRTQGRRPDTLR